MDLLTFRVLERILAVVIGGMSIFLGYRLFIKLPKRADSSGKILLPGEISVFFSRVGPGVFFSLFGAAVVVVALRHSLDFDVTHNAATAPNTGAATAAPANVTQMRIRYMDATGIDDTRRDALRAEARRTIAELSKLPSLLAPETPGSRRTDVMQAANASKLALMQSVWAADWGDFTIFRNWINDGEPDPAPPGFSPEAIRTYRQTRE